jgi:DNA-binding Lrp family transcriptional regulator
MRANQTFRLDELDVALIKTLTVRPRAGYLELSGLVRASRATVQARLERLERAGIITGYGPDIDPTAAGYPVRALVSLEMEQGRLEEVRQHLERIPWVLEAYATTGGADVLCDVRAVSHEGLQQILLEINRIPGVGRSTSVIALSQVVARRHVPLLEAESHPPAQRVPRYRSTTPAKKRAPKVDPQILPQR